MKLLDKTGLTELWARCKAFFAPKSHSHVVADITNLDPSEFKGEQGDPGPQGIQGWGLVATVDLGKYFTEAEWKTYGTIGHNEGWGNTESIRNGCRVGDVFFVQGTATDTGVAHFLTYRSTTASGNLYGVCIAHNYAERGEKGDKGDAGSNDYKPYSTNRDFTNGTLIRTSIDYSRTSGDPWYLNIQGNTYFRLYPCFTLAQGYIYEDTIISYGVVHHGSPIDGLVAMNLGGKLCFWFPRQGYWEGYAIRCTTAFDYSKNLVTVVEDIAKPSGTKEVDIGAQKMGFTYATLSNR